MRTRFLPVAFVIFSFFIYGYGKNLTIDENELFSDTSSLVQSSEIVNITPKKKKRRKVTYFNGIINSAFFGNVNRHWYDDPDSNNIKLTNFIVGNFMLDFRLPHSNKGFVNLEVPYSPSYNYSTWYNYSSLFQLREMFIDGNIGRKIYLRVGKQVLQWGRCRLWNPTDLINVEKKLFIPKIGYREGAYGLRTHIPFGTTLNLYGFLDTKSLSSFDSLATALKFEFLIQNTEMSLSLWAKPNNNLVAGYDVSTRIAGFDIVGELSVSEAANTYSVIALNDTLMKEKSGGLQTKACVDVGRKFNFLDFPDNLSMTLSFYFNSSGYDENMFTDTTRYQFKDSLYPLETFGFLPVGAGTKKEFLLGHNLYEQHNYSKYYGALFTQIDRVFISGLSGIVNIVTNLQQSSWIFSGGLSYASLHEFFAGILVSAYVGKENTEYTFDNRALAVQINVGMTFY